MWLPFRKKKVRWIEFLNTPAKLEMRLIGLIRAGRYEHVPGDTWQFAFPSIMVRVTCGDLSALVREHKTFVASNETRPDVRTVLRRLQVLDDKARAERKMTTKPKPNGGTFKWGV